MADLFTNTVATAEKEAVGFSEPKNARFFRAYAGGVGGAMPGWGQERKGY